MVLYRAYLPVRLMPLPPVLAMMLRAAIVVPPMVFDSLLLMRMPSPETAPGVIPSANRPMMLPVTVVFRVQLPPLSTPPMVKMRLISAGVSGRL